LKYSTVDQPVEVRVATEGNKARVSVRDHGPGVPASEQKLIWRRFYRVQGVRVRSGPSGGLGLGLHICKTIIERHGGQVGVESTVGVGSTFWFTLPLAHGTPHRYTAGRP
jgi:signal transduction histidine kinase